MYQHTTRASYVKPVGWLPDLLLNFHLTTILFWFQNKTRVTSVKTDTDQLFDSYRKWEIMLHSHPVCFLRPNCSYEI